MKKIIYLMLSAVLIMTACTNFDSEDSKNYGEGPSISINVTSTADSTFTFTLSPAEGTTYYSYVVTTGTEVTQISASSLLKKQITGVTSGVLNTSKNATYTFNMRSSEGEPLASPNTSYVIYAVASNEQGVIGDVVSQVVLTTDQTIPKPLSSTAADTTVTVKFSEDIVKGSGNVTAKYYKEWDITNPVMIDAADVDVSISGSAATISIKNLPSGAYVTVSWEAKAFTDVIGNACAALSSGLNLQTGRFTGVWFHVANKDFLVKDDYFSPTGGTSFSDWEAFTGTITFEYDIYRDDSAVETGDLTVSYRNSKSTLDVKLAPTQWSINGKVLSFVLPVSPQVGDEVTLLINKEVIYDVCGNANAAYSSDNMLWEYK
ncbi:MAG: hypothetical protein LKI39_08280 [Bacteroides sp.]|nr:hypothetical protein [Bacteroides sp.]MCI1682536.1 hypothetical protein [Bacteroides sp.]